MWISYKYRFPQEKKFGPQWYKTADPENFDFHAIDCMIRQQVNKVQI